MIIAITRRVLTHASGRIEFACPTRLACIRVAFALFGRVRIRGLVRVDGRPGECTLPRGTSRGVYVTGNRSQRPQWVSWVFSDDRDLGHVTLIAATIEKAAPSRNAPPACAVRASAHNPHGVSS